MRWGILYGCHLWPAGISGSLFIALTEFGFSSVSPTSGLDRPPVQSSAAFLMFSLPMKTASTAGLTELLMFAHNVCVCTDINVCISTAVLFSVAVGAGYEAGKKILKNVGEIKSLTFRGG